MLLKCLMGNSKLQSTTTDNKQWHQSPWIKAICRVGTPECHLDTANVHRKLVCICQKLNLVPLTHEITALPMKPRIMISIINYESARLGESENTISMRRPKPHTTNPRKKEQWKIVEVKNKEQIRPTGKQWLCT